MAVPDLVLRCIETLDERGLEIQGILRVSGSQTTVAACLQQLQKKKHGSLDNFDAHTIAGVLKKWLRDNAPLIPDSYYSSFIEIETDEEEAVVPVLIECLEQLPEDKLSILEVLIPFFNRVAQQSEANKMDASNLATVFAPTVFGSSGASLENILKELPKQTLLLKIMINHSNKIFLNEPGGSSMYVPSVHMVDAVSNVSSSRRKQVPLKNSFSPSASSISSPSSTKEVSFVRTEKDFSNNNNSNTPSKQPGFFRRMLSRTTPKKKTETSKSLTEESSENRNRSLTTVHKDLQNVAEEPYKSSKKAAKVSRRLTFDLQSLSSKETSSTSSISSTESSQESLEDLQKLHETGPNRRDSFVQLANYSLPSDSKEDEEMEQFLNELKSKIEEIEERQARQEQEEKEKERRTKQPGTTAAANSSVSSSSFSPIPSSNASSTVSSSSISCTSSLKNYPISSPQSLTISRSVSSTSIIEAGSLEELVDLLFDNPRFAEEFFFVYPYFATTSEVLQLLFKNPRSISSSTTFADIINLWFSRFDEDFTDATIREIKNFITRNKISNPISLVRKTPSKEKLGSLPTLWKADTKLKLNDGITENELCEFHEEEVARQLTLREYDFFSAIKLREFISKKNVTHNKRQNIEAMVDHFNFISHRVASDIVKCNIFEKRVEWLQFWISVAEKCYHLNNFESLMEILAGLSMSCVTRLKTTWKALDSSYQKKFNLVRTKCESSGNFKALRATIDTVAYEKGPYIPFLGMYLSDIAKTVEGVPSTVENKINFSKFKVIANVLSRIRNAQNETFPFEPVDAILQVLNDKSSVILNEKLLIEMSIESEINQTSTQNRRLSFGLETTNPIRTFSQAKLNIANKAKRFQTEVGVEIDIMYVDDRVIAMGFPKKLMLRKYVNFFDTAHPNHYKIYNLSDEEYDTSKFNGEVLQYPLDKHSPPSFDVLFRFVDSVNQWLNSSPLNVAAIHCKGHSKDRTIVMLSCWLLKTSKCYTAMHAIQHLGSCFKQDLQYRLYPSQLRYVSYCERNTKGEVIDISQKLVLDKLVLHKMPHFGKQDETETFFCLGKHGKRIYIEKVQSGDQQVFVCAISQVVANDVLLYCYYKKATVPIFSVQFNTGFLKGEKLRFLKRDLDIAHLDEDNKHFPKDFKVELYFTPLKKQKGKVPIESLEQKPPVKEAFKNFLSSYGGLEKYEFLEDVQNFKRISDKDPNLIKRHSIQIYSKHHHLLTVAASNRISERLNSPSLKMFDEAFNEIKEHLDQHEFNKFSLSNSFMNVEDVDQPNQESGNRICVACEKEVDEKVSSIVLGDFIYHWHCVKCSQCDKQIGSRTCVIKNQKAYCGDCEKYFFIKCIACGKNITSDMKKLVVEGEEKWWHRDCFYCRKCNHSSELSWVNGNLFCASHSEQVEEIPDEKDEKLKKLKDLIIFKADDICEYFHNAIKEIGEIASSQEIILFKPLLKLLSQANNLLEFIELPSTYQEPEIKESEEFYHLPEKVRQVKKAAQQAALRIIGKLDLLKAREEYNEVVECAKPIRDLYKLTESTPIRPLWKTSDHVPVCKKCKKKIYGIYVEAENTKYHQECFFCTYCKARIETKYAKRVLSTQEEELFCEEHSYYSNPSYCIGCKQMLEPGTSILTVNQLKYHPHCFKCTRCSSSLTEYHKHGTEYLCNSCHTGQKLKAFKAIVISATDDALSELEDLEKKLETETDNQELVKIATVLKWIHQERNNLEMPPGIPFPVTPTPSSATSKQQRMKEILEQLLHSAQEFLKAIKNLLSKSDQENLEIGMLAKGTQLVKQSLVPLQLEIE